MYIQYAKLLILCVFMRTINQQCTTCHAKPIIMACYRQFFIIIHERMSVKSLNYSTRIKICNMQYTNKLCGHDSVSQLTLHSDNDWNDSTIIMKVMICMHV